MCDMYNFYMEINQHSSQGGLSAIFNSFLLNSTNYTNKARSTRLFSNQSLKKFFPPLEKGFELS